jgi:Redoxin
MKKIAFIFISICSFVLMSFWVKEGLDIGSTLPMQDAKLKDVNGTTITMLDAKKENGLLVMFSCNTCPFVVSNQERTKEVCALALKNNIGVIILNSNEAKRDNDDSYEAMQKYYKTQNYNWYYALDENSAVADAFGANRTPECYLFNKDLKLAYFGGIDNNASDATAVTRKHLQIAIEEMATGKEIYTKKSKSVGCSIKRKG